MIRVNNEIQYKIVFWLSSACSVYIATLKPFCLKYAQAQKRIWKWNYFALEKAYTCLRIYCCNLINKTKIQVKFSLRLINPLKPIG
jgi:hypothetical protein